MTIEGVDPGQSIQVEEKNSTSLLNYVIYAKSGRMNWRIYQQDWEKQMWR